MGKDHLVMRRGWTLQLWWKAKRRTPMHTSMGGGAPLSDGATIEVTDPTCDMMLPESQMPGRDGEEEAPLRRQRKLCWRQSVGLALES